MTSNLTRACAAAALISAIALPALAQGGPPNDPQTKRQQESSTVQGTNPATNQASPGANTPAVDPQQKRAEESPAVQGANPGAGQGPVREAPSGTAHPKALPGMGQVPKGN